MFWEEFSMARKQKSIEEIDMEYKHKLRKIFHEYPALYYKYKEYLKNNTWDMAAYLLFDKYEEMKDPVAWMKRQEEYAEHEKHSKQLQAAHAARETQDELREWQSSVPTASHGTLTLYLQRQEWQASRSLELQVGR